MNIQNFTQVLQSVWSKETSYYPDKWSRENPALGQCSPTALVLQDYFGGEIVWAKVLLPDGNDEDHYYNIIRGETIDMTASQFPVGTVIPIGTQKNKTFSNTRDFMLSYENTWKRYEILRYAVSQKLIQDIY